MSLLHSLGWVLLQGCGVTPHLIERGKRVAWWGQTLKVLLL